MTMAPMQVLVVRHLDEAALEPFETAIVRAFKGGREVGGYFATGEDLGVELKSLSGMPALAPDALLDSFCHTLAIVFIGRQLLDKGDDALWRWLADCWTHVDQSNGRHRLLPFASDEGVADEFANRPGLAALQVQPVHRFGEKALRPAMIALFAIHEARRLLAEALPRDPSAREPPAFLRLFISHAKLDGLPLAQALLNLIESTGWLRSFYDAKDLPAGCNWQRELEHGAGSSLIIMLRTEAYDERYWCQQEVRWADEFSTPAVLVDARTGLNQAATRLPFGRAPAVRIPDGNLMRILAAALREGLRFLLFARRVEEMKRSRVIGPDVALRSFSNTPSMRALLRACLSFDSAKSGEERLILYPDPPLESGDYEAARALVASRAPGAVLATPETLAVLKGATS